MVRKVELLLELMLNDRKIIHNCVFVSPILVCTERHVNYCHHALAVNGSSINVPHLLKQRLVCVILLEKQEKQKSVLKLRLYPTGFSLHSTSLPHKAAIPYFGHSRLVMFIITIFNYKMFSDHTCSESLGDLTATKNTFLSWHGSLLLSFCLWGWHSLSG